MFSPDIVDSDAFLDMPVSSQLLYFHLAMRADDDGFISPKKVMRMIGVADDDLKILLAKRFLLAFENGVVVIKHWLIHNLIRQDRYTPTNYTEEKKQLKIKENGAYTETVNEAERQPIGNQTATNGCPRLGKVRLGKRREEGLGETPKPPTPKILMIEFINSFKTQNESYKNFIQALIEKGIPQTVLDQEIPKFINYWTEKNPSGKKERWELQKVFEVNRRLGTWFSNAGKWSNNKQSKIAEMQ